MASFRVAGFCDVLDWRPLLFQEPQREQRACVLCGVVYKTALWLPCRHTVCFNCHAQLVHGVCPVDQKPYSEDDVEKLETTAEDISRRKVACWNTARGCSFIGTAVSLLEHYKECEFIIVPCCVCHSSVMRCNILEHFKSGCNMHLATCDRGNNPGTEEPTDVSRAYLKMKDAMRKCSEDLMSLQMGLNRCSEDVRAECARCKDQWEAQASRLNDLNMVCTTGFAKELRVLQATMADNKEHLSNELSVQMEKLLRRPRKVHWYFEGWKDLKKRASESNLASFESPTRVMYDYSVTQLIELSPGEDELHFGCFLRIKPGDNDLELEWPFRKVCTFGVIHPKDKLNVIPVKVEPEEYKHAPFLERPKGEGNRGFGTARLATAEKLEKEGFVENDALHLFLEIEP